MHGDGDAGGRPRRVCRAGSAGGGAQRGLGHVCVRRHQCGGAACSTLGRARPGRATTRGSGAQGDTRAALEALLGADPANRPTAAAALRHPAFRLQAPRRGCCICFEEALRADGVECDGDPRHFVCRECFAELINAQSQKDLMVLQRCGGRVSCPARPCAAGPFSDAQVAAMTSSEVFSNYIVAPSWPRRGWFRS